MVLGTQPERYPFQAQNLAISLIKARAGKRALPFGKGRVSGERAVGPQPGRRETREHRSLTGPVGPPAGVSSSNPFGSFVGV